MLLGVAILYGSAALQASKSCQNDIRGHRESFGINVGHLHTGSNDPPSSWPKSCESGSATLVLEHRESYLFPTFHDDSVATTGRPKLTALASPSSAPHLPVPHVRRVHSTKLTSSG